MFQVLIVEDEQILANNLVRSIRQAGLEANTSDTGTKALSICHDVVFDVLCIDIGLPDCNGLDLLERLRLLQPAIQVIVMSGEGTVVNKARAQKLGAQAFLTKPFQLSALRRLLKDLSEAANQNQLQSQQLKVQTQPGRRRP